MFTRTRNVSYGVLVDVASGSIGIGIVASHHTETVPTVLYAHRERMRVGTEPTTEDRVRAMRHALFAATLHLNQEGIKKLKEYDSSARVTRLLLVCAAPWSATITRLVHIEEKEPFVVTHERLEALIKDVERQDVEEASQHVTLKGMRVQLTERAVIHTMLNGYLVHDPYDKKAYELTLAHLSGLVPDEVLKAVKDIEKNVLHHPEETTHTYALVLYCVLRDLYPHTKNALIMDISGEATEIGIMRDNILYETYVLPYGDNTVLRDIAKRLGTIPEEARSHIEGYTRGDAPEKIKEAVAAAMQTYVSELKSVYATIAEQYVIPTHIFLTAQKQAETFFTNILMEHPPETSTAAAMTVATIGSTRMDDLANFETEVTKDLFLAVSARFFHKLHACGELD